RYTSRQPENNDIAGRMPTTLASALGETNVALVLAVPRGILNAVKKVTCVESTLRAFALTGISMPVYWLGIVSIIALAVRVPVFPPGGGMDQHGIRALVPPSLVLGISFAALLMLLLRSSSLDAMGNDYVRTARSKGLAARVVLLRHVLKNAAAPALTVAGLQFGSILGGAVLTEIVFSLPGLGRLLYESIGSRDYPTLQAAVL